MLMINLDVQWQVWQLNPLWLPELMFSVERYRAQGHSREARPQVLKEESGVEGDAAAKKAWEVSGLRGAWREEHRAAGEDNFTTSPYSQANNSSSC